MNKPELFLDLLKDLLDAKPNENAAFADFKKFFDEDFMAFANEENSLADEARAIGLLQALEQQLEDFVAFPHTFTKRSIAIGGGFSSGKSSLVNSFRQQAAVQLPVDLTPTTAIPSYVVSSAAEAIRGSSGLVNNATVEISSALYGQLSHDGLAELKLNLRRILDAITVEMPLREGLFEHLCLIDTPGYNPAGESTTEDRSTAASFLQERDALIWVIGLDATGTVPSDDLDFLHGLELEGEPLYMVLNKADSKAPSERQEILDEVEETLAEEGLEPAGISVYSAECDEEYLYVGQGLDDFLRGQNQPRKPAELGAKLKAELESVLSMYEKAIEEDEKSAKLLTVELNKLDLDLNKLGVDADAADAISEKMGKIKNSQNRNFAATKQKLAQVKEEMIAKFEQVLLSLVEDDPQSVAELKAAWRQQEEAKRRSRAASKAQQDRAKPRSGEKPVGKPSQPQRQGEKGIGGFMGTFFGGSVTQQLIQAMKNNDHERVAKLLGQGADPNVQDDEGCTPLHWAAMQNAHKTAKVLLDHRRTTNVPKDKRGCTPLHYAAKYNARKTARLLLNAKAYINSVDNKGYTPLHYALRYNAHETARLLRDYRGR